jgi:hypothetical protein
LSSPLAVEQSVESLVSGPLLVELRLQEFDDLHQGDSEIVQLLVENRRFHIAARRVDLVQAEEGDREADSGAGERRADTGVNVTSEREGCAEHYAYPRNEQPERDESAPTPELIATALYEKGDFVLFHDSMVTHPA